MKISYYYSKLIKKLHLPAIKDSKIDKTSKICSGSHIVETVLDRYSYVGNFCTIINSDIGKFCSIADNCIIGGASHPIDWLSTSPVFYKGENVLRKNFTNNEFESYKKTQIGNDVWIGSNVMIKGGLNIGHGAVIGMGSVLTKDVGDYEIWAGNPAKFIRRRFNIEVSKALLSSKWWDSDDDVLSKISKNFNEVKLFIGEVTDEDNVFMR